MKIRNLPRCLPRYKNGFLKDSRLLLSIGLQVYVLMLLLLCGAGLRHSYQSLRRELTTYLQYQQTMPPHQLLPTQSLLAHPHTLPASASLLALPGTDVWSVPPSIRHFSAPFICTSLPLSSFRRINATVTANFFANTQQGGLLLVLPPQQGLSPAGEDRRWVSATLEYEHERMNVSVVSCERWSDWCLRPVEANTVRLQMERLPNADGSKGTRLRVSMQDEEGKYRIIREVTWAFEQDAGEIWVGILANKASAEGNEEGEEVRFEDIVLETW
jgi:regulation of enolase protein 1 (concanavalin A-like superfamily)